MIKNQSFHRFKRSMGTIIIWQNAIVVDFTRQLNFLPEFKTISIDKKKLIQQCL
jgi:hypothetical protein